jgi:uncharacterized protein
MSMPTQPRSERFDCLDTLRGVAVLGILMVNIQYFAMVSGAVDVPMTQMDFSPGINRDVWIFSQVFFNMKFMTLFSGLFGAGVVLMLGEKSAGHSRHFRRMLWLLLFGMVHAYLFSYTDVLVPYALAGMVIVTARQMSIAGLVGLGAGLIGFTGFMMVAGVAMAGIGGDTITAQALLGFNPENVAEITEAYQAGFFNRLPYNMSQALMNQLMQLVFLSGRIAGVMLLGMAAYKSGFLTCGWDVRRYSIWGGSAGLVGLLMSGWAVFLVLDTNFSLVTAWQAVMAQYIGSLLLAFGYAAGVMLICKQALIKPVRQLLASVGRMSLSHYLLQSLILTILFVGMPGFGLFGQVERGWQLVIVLVIWALQLGVSTHWLNRFHYGPMEWAWRSLTYGRFQDWSRVDEESTPSL